MKDHSWVTDEMFAEKLEELVVGMTTTRSLRLLRSRGKSRGRCERGKQTL